MTAEDAAETTTAWGLRRPDGTGAVYGTTSEFQSREAARRHPDLWAPVCRTVTYGPWEDALPPVAAAARGES